MTPKETQEDQEMKEYQEKMKKDLAGLDALMGGIRDQTKIEAERLK